MAKRNNSESSKRSRRQVRAEPAEPAAIAAEESRPTTPSELPDIPEPGDIADQALRSESMSSEPSQEDIRLRAYQRYLERGSSHGRHFDDWIEAEQELKGRK